MPKQTESQGLCPHSRDLVTLHGLNCVTHPCCDENSWTCCDCQSLNVSGVRTLVVSNTVPAWRTLTSIPWDKVSAIVQTHHWLIPQMHRLTPNPVQNRPTMWTLGHSDGLVHSMISPVVGASHLDLSARLTNANAAHHGWQNCGKILLVATVVLPGTRCR